MLGRRTAELHRALALRTGYPSFDPEPLTAQDLQAYRVRAATEAAETLALLERHLAELPPATQADAQALLARRTAVLERIEAAASMPAAWQTGGVKTRYHGDYHLGQVLVTGNDFVIIDFEGEPGRSFEERRAKGPALRDVAGMLRSFNYARWAALKHASQSTEELLRLDAAVRQWENATRTAFLEAYAAAAASHAPGPAREGAEALLRLFELEKALYELRYELNNRADWVQVPLQGILALIGAAGVP
jgi:maltose alpha-D-glucosyltransferase/alpha-amylase